VEAGFEGTVCAWSWLSPTLGWQKFNQARWEEAPSLDLETRADHMSSPGKATMLSATWGRFSIRIIESSNHRMVWVGRDLKDHLVPTPMP